jgi:hypothetical protein
MEMNDRKGRDIHFSHCLQVLFQEVNEGEWRGIE